MREEKRTKGYRVSRSEWARGRCYTFRGASRIWWDFVSAKLESNGQRVRSFENVLDAEQFLFACGRS